MRSTFGSVFTSLSFGPGKNKSAPTSLLHADRHLVFNLIFLSMWVHLDDVNRYGSISMLICGTALLGFMLGQNLLRQGLLLVNWTLLEEHWVS
jgi:hypothetical protein